jgi:hypothetical protein
MPSKFGGIPIDPPRSRFGGTPVQADKYVPSDSRSVLPADDTRAHNSFDDESRTSGRTYQKRRRASKPGEPLAVPPDPPLETSSLVRQLAGDTGVSLLKGAIAVPEALVGLSDLLTAGQTGKLLEQWGFRPKDAKEILDQLYSPEHKRARETVQKAEGFAGTLAQAVRHPSTIAQAVAESAPSMLTGGAVARGLQLIPKVAQLSPLSRGAIGEGVVSGGLSAERIRQETPTGTLAPAQAGLAAGSGMLTGLLGFAGGTAARKLGIADVEVLLAGGKPGTGPSSLLGRAARASGGAVTEGVLEELPQSVQEEVLTNIALGKPAMEGVPQAAAMGMLAGGVMGGGVGGLTGRHTAPIPPTTPGAGSAQAQILERVQTQAGVRAMLAHEEIKQQAIDQQQAGPLAHARALLDQAGQFHPLAGELADAAAQPANMEQDRPVSGAPEPFAGSQNVTPMFEKLGLSPEHQASALQLLTPVEPHIAERRRGTVSWEETKQLADLSGFTVEDLKKRRLGQPFNAEQMLTAMEQTQQAMTRTLELQQLVRSGQATDIQKAEFVRQVAELGSITAETMGARAEAGRTMNIMRRSVDSVRNVQRLIDSVGGATGVDGIANAMQDVIDRGGVGAAAKLARSIGAPKFWDFYKAMLLTAPSTHIVNAVSNVATALLQIPERATAAAIGAGKRAVGLNGETRWREPVYQVAGMLSGAVAGMQAAVDGWKTGEPALGAPRHEGQTGTRGAGMLARTERVWGAPFRALTASDNFFAMTGEGMERYALASRQAVREAKAGKITQDEISARTAELINNPTESIRQAASEAALYQTFNHKAGTIASKFMEMRAAHPSLNLIAPFIRTPANIVSFALRRTPAAVLFEDVRTDILAGGARQEIAVARILTGSLLGAATVVGTSGGWITGGGPEDPRERAALMATGWRPYSIRIGDKWYEYQRFEPLGVLIGLAADLSEISRHVSDDEKANLATLIAQSAGRNLVSKTYMQGITEAMQAMTDPDRYGERWVNRSISTLVQPATVVSHIAREQDEYQREARGLIDSIKRRIPGLRATLPPRLDNWGAPIREDERLGPDFISPVKVGTPSGDPVRQEAARLGFSPGKPSKTITYQGEKVELTPGQYEWLQETAGRLAYIQAQQAVMSPVWRALPDTAKAALFQRFIEQGRDVARAVILADHFRPEARAGAHVTEQIGALEAQRGITAGEELARARGTPRSRLGGGMAEAPRSRFGGVPVQ